MSEPTKPNPELSGWKEIADYLGVSIRTAQTFEHDQALPIHRMPGTKGRVWTTADELAAWKVANCGAMTRQPSNGPDARAASDDAVEPEQASQQDFRIDRRSWLRYGALAGGAAALVGVGVARFRLKGNPPLAGLRVEGSAVIAVAPGGGELWRHAFENRLSSMYPPAPFAEPPYCLIADLDGDGRDEVLFRHASAADPFSNMLFCFDAFGNVRWQFIPGKTVTDTLGRDWTRPYAVQQVRVVRGQTFPIPRVVVESVHYLSFPTQVAVLDGKTGGLLSEYWHRGHLQRMVVADLDGSGEPHVLLAGVNDAPDHKRATLVVFDNRRVAGASCSTKGEPYFQGMSPGTEEKIVFFPRTPASADKEFNFASALTIRSERILVAVSEGPVETSPALAYEFDFALHVTNVVLTGELRQRYIELQQTGRLAKGPLDFAAIEKALGEAVEEIPRNG